MAALYRSNIGNCRFVPRLFLPNNAALACSQNRGLVHSYLFSPGLVRQQCRNQVF
jgi:hypothetical protein